MGGALVANVKTKSYSEGASTISQQLIKNTHLSQEKTFTRKLKEIRLARQMEKQLSKEEILAAYLNVIYFGGGVYGVSEAADTYFGKTPENLTVSECATLAAVIKNPSKYNPTGNSDALTERRNLVLKLMNQQDKLGNEQYSAAVSAPLTVVDTPQSQAKSYARSALTEAATLLGMTEAELRLSGCVINTYFNKDMQELLKKTIDETNYMASNDDGDYPSRAALLTDNVTLGISAYYNSDANSVYAVKRQLGSTIKPLLVYSPALDNGVISPASPVIDEKTDFGGYSPSNYGDVYYGKTDIRTAVSKSLNVPAVKTLNEVGVDTAMHYARQLGLTLTDTDANLSLALGGTTYGNTLLELADGYTCLANNGVRGGVTFIKSIEKDGKTLYNHTPILNRVFDEETAYLMTDMLRETVASGTARSLFGVGADVAAKTGTVAVTGKNRDAYAVCYTTAHTLAVWHGAADGDYMSDGETGGAYTAKAATAILKALYANEKPSPFVKPEGIVTLSLDKVAYDKGLLQLAVPNTPAAYVFEAEFNGSYAPYEYAESFTDLSVPEINSTSTDAALTLAFTPKKHLCYEIKRSAFWGDEILFTVAGTEEPVSLAISKTPLDFLSRFSITAYYIDDSGVRVNGDTADISS